MEIEDGTSLHFRLVTSEWLMEALLDDQRTDRYSSANLTLSCDGGTIPVHPSIFTCAGSGIHNMLKDQDTSEPSFIHFDGVSLSTLSTMIKLVYTGTAKVRLGEGRALTYLLKKCGIDDKRIDSQPSEAPEEPFHLKCNLNDAKQNQVYNSEDEVKVQDDQENNNKAIQISPPGRRKRSLRQRNKNNQKRIQEISVNVDLQEDQGRSDKTDTGEWSDKRLKVNSKTPAVRTAKVKTKSLRPAISASNLLLGAPIAVTDPSPPHNAISLSSAPTMSHNSSTSTSSISILPLPVPSTLSSVAPVMPQTSNLSPRQVSAFPSQFANGEWKFVTEQQRGDTKYGIYMNSAKKLIGVPACQVKDLHSTLDEL